MTATEQYTLLAAVVAAVASVLGVFVTAASIYFERRTTKEAQHRDLLKPYIVDLGDTLHRVIACSQVVVHRAAREQPTDKWQRLAGDACTKLKELRLKVKYPLWGLDAGLNEMTRLASYVSHQRHREEFRQPLLDAAENLRSRLDEAIRISFLSGRPPGDDTVSSVDSAAQLLHNAWRSPVDDPLVDD